MKMEKIYSRLKKENWEETNFQPSRLRGHSCNKITQEHATFPPVAASQHVNETIRTFLMFIGIDINGCSQDLQTRLKAL